MWFYYDGKDLRFGKPTDLPTIDLVYGVDLEFIRSSMKMSPVNFQSYSNRSTIDYTFSGSSPGSVKGLDFMGNEAMAVSGAGYQIVSKAPVRVRFLWQNPDERSPWLRVMNPDAGKSDVVSKNRGSLFSFPKLMTW